LTGELATISNTPINTATSPTTSTAYWAMATAWPGVLATASLSSGSAPGALPEASCHEPAGAASTFSSIAARAPGDHVPRDRLLKLALIGTAAGAFSELLAAQSGLASRSRPVWVIDQPPGLRGEPR